MTEINRGIEGVANGRDICASNLSEVRTSLDILPKEHGSDVPWRTGREMDGEVDRKGVEIRTEKEYGSR